MECTSATAVAAPSAARTVAPAELLAAFAAVPDPRRRASVAYPLPAILALAVAAILAAHESVLAIAAWGARQAGAVLAPLGFAAGRTPCHSTLHRLFRQRDGSALAAALRAHRGPARAPAPAARGTEGVAIDGKAQRGRLRDQDGGGPVHALSACCHERGVVLAHAPIAQGATKAEAELTVAPALLAPVDWRGRVLTGDALHGQRATCQQVLAAGGDDLLLVKANQPARHDAIARLCDPPPDAPPPLPLLDRRAARTVAHGHGRAADTRHLIAATDLTGYRDWPGVAPVFRLERTWRARGQRKRQLHYGIASLPPATGPAARLLARKRGHWLIEHHLHRSKDGTLGEDARLVHTGQGPTILALLRDTARSLLRRAGIRQITARLRYHRQHPEAAVALLCGPGHTDA